MQSRLSIEPYSTACRSELKRSRKKKRRCIRSKVANSIQMQCHRQKQATKSPSDSLLNLHSRHLIPFKLIFRPFQIVERQLNKWAHKMQIGCKEHSPARSRPFETPIVVNSLNVWCCCCLKIKSKLKCSRYWVTAMTTATAIATVSKFQTNAALTYNTSNIAAERQSSTFEHMLYASFVPHLKHIRASATRMSPFDLNLINGSKTFSKASNPKLNLMIWNVQISTESIKN